MNLVFAFFWLLMAGWEFGIIRFFERRHATHLAQHRVRRLWQHLVLLGDLVIAAIYLYSEAVLR